MTRIKRTPLSYQPRSVDWVSCPWTGDPGAFADVVISKDYPTHSPVLGPDGLPLEYEPRPAMGFDLRGKGSKAGKDAKE
jgi:hypothetical protein